MPDTISDDHSVAQPDAETGVKKNGASNHGGFVANYLLYLLAAASQSASAQFHARVRELGVRVPEWRVLACLHDGDGAMITRLADVALLEQSSLTKIVAQMDERGWVTRGGDASDRRRVRVYLTRDGRALAQQLVKEARAHETGLLAELSDTGGERIKPVLQALLSHLSDADRP